MLMRMTGTLSTLRQVARLSGIWGVITLCIACDFSAGAARAETAPVKVFGQFGETRYAATEAMKRLQAILDLVYGEAGLEPEYVPVPFNRAYQQVINHPGSCLAAVTRSAETEQMLRWMFPVTETRVIVIGPVLSETPDEAASVEMLRRAEAKGIVSLDGAGQVLLQGAGIRHDSRPTADTVVKMVAAGRVRYGVLLSVTFDLLGNDEKSGVRVLGPLQVQTIWHACHRDLPQEQANRLTAAWAHLKEDGRLAAVYVRFQTTVPPP